MNNIQNNNSLPISATNSFIALVSLSTFFLAVAFLRLFQSHNIVYAALFVMGCTATVVVLFETFYFEVYKRASTGLDMSINNSSLSRSLVKWMGLLGSYGFVAFFYWLFPEYHGSFYDRYYEMLRIITIPIFLLAMPYIYLLDRKMKNPQDGFWHMGKAMLLKWEDVDISILWKHLLGWIIKGYFLPLMFIYLCNDLTRILVFDFTTLVSFKSFYDFCYDFFYFIDVGLVTIAYIMSLRLIDTHLRSAESTLFGWVVALVCYEPFWSLIGSHYLAFDSGHAWGMWLSDTSLFYCLWGSMILLLLFVYVWATVSFGFRFSNLTNRGIITSGPYRFTKHPAYLAKNISWWLISVPFLVYDNSIETLHHCLLLLSVNGIYFFRAKTEERHLSQDPTYLQYTQWIEEHGIFQNIRGWYPNWTWDKRFLNEDEN